MSTLEERGRAMTPEAKNRVIEMLRTVWMRSPSLRLGQLIENAVATTHPPDVDLFYIEDEVIVKALKAFDAKYGESRKVPL